MKELVAYFSASGTTKKVALKISKTLKANLFEIEPVQKYTQQDLNWMDKNSRSSLEMKDKSSRPEIKAIPENLNDYDIIYLGFPIWWYVAPTIINTFLESCNLDGKIIVPFATSGGSGYGKTNNALAPSCKNATLKNGKIFSQNPTEEEIISWAKNIKNG